MGVCTDHDLARCCPAFLDRHLVADTLVDIIVVDVLLCCKLPHVDMVARRLDGVCRYLVVKEHDDAFWVKDFSSAHLVELLDGKRAGDIMDHRPVKRGHDHFACPHVAATFPGEYLLYDCRCHAQSGYKCS